jgi:hypothetical protein
MAIIGAGFTAPEWRSHSGRQATPHSKSSKKRTALEGHGGIAAIPVVPYSLSFEQIPGWSRSFSLQRKIWRYMKDCASKYAIISQMRFDAAVARPGRRLFLSPAGMRRPIWLATRSA